MSPLSENATKIRSWEDVAQRMRNATNGSRGVSFVTIRVFLNQGRPVAWISPEVQHVEPKGDAAGFAEWLETLCT